jgi:uncharacterized protein (DUF1697 family)
MPKATYVALMRAVNLGGKNKLPMLELRQMFEAAGCEAVRSYIQSGNVIFRGSPRMCAALCSKIPEQIGARYGFQPPVVLRSTEELEEAIANNPYLAAGVPEELLHLMFLADEPGAAAVKQLDPHRSPPDEFTVCGRDIYLKLPNGAGQTKLTNQYFDAKLKTISTSRNWRTVKTLLEMMKEK